MVHKSERVKNELDLVSMLLCVLFDDLLFAEFDDLHEIVDLKQGIVIFYLFKISICPYHNSNWKCQHHDTTNDGSTSNQLSSDCNWHEISVSDSGHSDNTPEFWNKIIEDSRVVITNHQNVAGILVNLVPGSSLSKK